ncbi:hypothetical protein QT711_13865 [Sporosarcina saromensis]|uniref:Uncharacterized protein n=1 Tax=Sporosarcina saromensis TaxID=359365 RepID=A0ABU4GBB8_9BACL|nr:hypothetical protein [Sporosarcina saromensis]MDW0114279.1 hypothetical protein [Sporosarcina saromensis]
MGIHTLFLLIASCIVGGQILTLIFIWKNRFRYANRFIVYPLGILPVLLAFLLGLLNVTVIDELNLNGDSRLFYLELLMLTLGLATLWSSFSIAARIKANDEEKRYSSMQ